MKTILVAIQELFKNLRVDDILHFLVCFTIAFVVGQINFVAGIVTALVVGILKEVYDYYHPKNHTYSRRDVFFDFAGIVTAFILMVIINEIKGW